MQVNNKSEDLRKKVNQKIEKFREKPGVTKFLNTKPMQFLMKIKSKWQLLERKKQGAIITALIITIIYLIMANYIIHIYVVEEVYGLGTLEAITQGFYDMLKYPFEIFPIPFAAIRTIFWITVGCGLIALLMIPQMRAKAHYNEKIALGDAKWMDSRALAKYNIEKTEPFGKASTESKNNMILARDFKQSLDNKKTRRNNNVLIIGASGRGKTFYYLVPNLLQANGQISYVFSDPSGELYRDYAGFFETQGYQIKCLNLKDMHEGNHFNPFCYLKNDKDVATLVTAIMENTQDEGQSESDPFWKGATELLLKAVIAYLREYADKEHQNFAEVMRMIRLGEITEVGNNTSSKLDDIFEVVGKDNKNSFAYKQYCDFKIAAGATLKSILISVSARMSAFDLQDLVELTKTDDIELDSICDMPTALFIITETTDKTFDFVSALLYTQLIKRSYTYCETDAKYSSVIRDGSGRILRTFRANSGNCEEVEAKAQTFAKEISECDESCIRYNSNLEWFEIWTKEYQTTNEKGENVTIPSKYVTYRKTEELVREALSSLKGTTILKNGSYLPSYLRLMLDEFASIRIPNFSKTISTCRKYHLACSMIVQSTAQLKEIFNDGWETLSGNADNLIYLGGGSDATTTDWISKLIGNETRKVMGQSFNQRNGSTNINAQGVALQSVNQLRELPENYCVILPTSMDPFKGPLFDPRTHENWKYVGRMYRFDRRKAEFETQTNNSFREYIRNQSAEEKHGGVEEKSDIAKEVKADAAAKEQLQSELKANATADGTKFISKPEAVSVEDDSVTVALGINNKDELDKAMNSIIELNKDMAKKYTVMTQYSPHYKKYYRMQNAG